MAGLGATAATSVKMILMTFGGAIAVVSCIIAMAIFSIIPTFTSNHATEGYGEEYRCPAIMLKSIYTTTTTDSFVNGSIADNPSLSTLSTSAYKSLTSQSNVYGCIVENMRGWMGSNDSTTTSRRRRRATTMGLYSIGDMRIFYSTPCSKQSDVGKYSNATSISGCVKARLTAANSIFTKSGALTEWTPVPNSLVYSIVNSALTAYDSLSITRIFGVRPSNAASIANSFTVPVPAATQSAILAGCVYEGQLSHSAIAAIIASQYTESTTLPTATTVSG
ncbi:unnamed protein product [Adineta steineri]|uniref:Uncharacterized protein n=1 Tax=Adineta steineri TaxID=433720 RepID=A0A814A671_9BILA|nr:unnamed protein product [Adineta steineri]CAF0910140.1 unnamed protein product [Adineta steineri]